MNGYPSSASVSARRNHGCFNCRFRGKKCSFTTISPNSVCENCAAHNTCCVGSGHNRPATMHQGHRDYEAYMKALRAWIRNRRNRDQKVPPFPGPIGFKAPSALSPIPTVPHNQGYTISAITAPYNQPSLPHRTSAAPITYASPPFQSHPAPAYAQPYTGYPQSEVPSNLYDGNQSYQPSYTTSLQNPGFEPSHSNNHIFQNTFGDAYASIPPAQAYSSNLGPMAASQLSLLHGAPSFSYSATPSGLFHDSQSQLLPPDGSSYFPPPGPPPPSSILYPQGHTLNPQQMGYNNQHYQGTNTLNNGENLYSPGPSSWQNGVRTVDQPPSPRRRGIRGFISDCFRKVFKRNRGRSSPLNDSGDDGDDGASTDGPSPPSMPQPNFGMNGAGVTVSRSGRM